MTAMAATGDIHAGLWYVMAFAGLAVIIGTLWFRETHGKVAEG